VATQEVQIRLLGRFRATAGGRELPAAAFGGRKVRTLLAVLALDRDRYVSHDALADALWPDAPPADPAGNLGVLVNRARRALGDPGLIRTGPRGYALDARCGLDTARFAGLVEQARRHPPDRPALRCYQEALAGWTGPPLPEHADAPWAREFRTALLGLRQAALEEAAGLAARLGEVTLAVGYAEEAVAAAPLREVAALRLSRAHELAGDRAAALDDLRQLRLRLRDELGVDPSAEVTDRYAELLDPAHRPPAAPLAGELPFVGRSGQLTALLAAVRDPVPPVVTVAAAAGSGKSRLLAELAAALDRPVLSARAYLPERAEPWSLARGLLRAALATDRDVAGALPGPAVPALLEVVPDLADLLPRPPADLLDPAPRRPGSLDPASRRTESPDAASWQGGPLDPATRRPGSLDPATRRALVLEGAVRMLVAAAPAVAVLALDDLQWADPDSLLVVADLLDRVPGLPAVLAYRPEEALPGGLLRSALAGLADRRQVRPVALPPLALADLGQVLDAEIARVVLAGTEGLPFAVAEVVRELTRSSTLTRDPGGGRWTAVSPDVAAREAAAIAGAGRRRRLLAQVERHPPADRTVLGLLSLLARQVPAETLATAAVLPTDDVLGSLSALSAAGLVRLGDRGWATSHDLVRETVAADLAEADRARLHARLAAALAGGNADPVELAEHLAGAGDSEAAARQYATAAGQRVEGADDAGVAELVDAGLALADRGEPRNRLLEVRARLRARRGDLPGARSDLREALIAEPDLAARSGLRARLAMLYSGAEDLDRAAGLAELAVLDAGDDPTALARALEVAAIVDMNREQPNRSARRFDRALELYQEQHDAAGAARILDGRAMATFLDGRIPAALELFSQVADLLTDSGDLLHVVTPASTAGHALVFGADPAAGLVRTTAALELARSLGHAEGVTYALWHRSEALAALGDADEAAGCAREALAVAGRIEHRGWTATALRALGIALRAGGDLPGAAEAFRRSLDTASGGLTLFSSWAAAQLALTVIAGGDLAAAGPLVHRALTEGPALAQYEARLARAELACVRRRPEAAAIAADAARLARAGGHLASVPRLEELGGIR
jgi:DNA-binding SARP family transcriptional activator/tetratricopeptide (TPR) repeat protein